MTEQESGRDFEEEDAVLESLQQPLLPEKNLIFRHGEASRLLVTISTKVFIGHSSKCTAQAPPSTTFTVLQSWIGLISVVSVMTQLPNQ